MSSGFCEHQLPHVFFGIFAQIPRLAIRRVLGILVQPGRYIGAVYRAHVFVQIADTPGKAQGQHGAQQERRQFLFLQVQNLPAILYI